MLLEFYLLVNFMARNQRKLEKLDKKKFQTPFAKELRSTLFPLHLVLHLSLIIFR